MTHKMTKRALTQKRINKANELAKRARNSGDRRKAKRALRVLACILQDSEYSPTENFDAKAWARRQLRRYFRLALRVQR